MRLSVMKMKRQNTRIGYKFVEITKKQYIWGLLIVPLYVGILRYFILEPLLNRVLRDDPNIQFWAGPLKNSIILVYMIFLFRDNISSFWEDFISSGLRDDLKWIVKSIYYFFVGRVIYALLYVQIKLIMANRFNVLTSNVPQNEKFLDGIAARFPVIAIIQVIILAPILEELIFRYLIYHILRRINKGCAILLTSLTFSVLHIAAEIQNGQLLEMLYFGLSYMAIAVVLAIVYEKRRNIIFCVILHMVNNVLAIAV